MSEKMERALSKSMTEKRMREERCSCTVILETGEVRTIERYARDFAELYYMLYVVEHIQKLITYMVIR
jgi:hypothetical protein